MLPKKNRLPLQEGLFLKNKKLAWSGHLFNVFIQEQGAVVPQISIVVSRQISASSVVRHKAKRRLAEAIYPLLKVLPRRKILVYTKKEITITPLSQIKEELTRAVKTLSKKANQLL